MQKKRGLGGRTRSPQPLCQRPLCVLFTWRACGPHLGECSDDVKDVTRSGERELGEGVWEPEKGRPKTRAREGKGERKGRHVDPTQGSMP
jgi:hypothetical protein